MTRLNFKDFDFAFIDIETTGRSFNHEIIEIAVLRVSSYNFSVLEEWVVKIKPRHLEIAEPEALKINHYNDKDWLEALDEETALKIFLEKTEKTILIGHNITFDWLYIHKALAVYNLEPTFWYKSLDTVSLAWQKLRHNQIIKSFSLGELATYFGISREKPHSALDDVRTTCKVFLKLINTQ